MSKRVSSSDWTGPIDQAVRRGAFTHRIGEFGGTTDYALISRKEPFTLSPPPELRGLIRLAALLLLSPLVLVAGWLAGQAGVRDVAVSDPSAFLLLWGFPVFAFAFWQLISRSLQLRLVRSFLLLSLMIATLAISIGYAVVAQRAHAEAVVGEPQRVFRYATGPRKNMLGRRTAVFRHQRADGSDLEGKSKWPPLAHGHCMTAQSVKGSHGFLWLRVIEQMPPLRSGQLGWPVRREDCFSDTPLSELVR